MNLVSYLTFLLGITADIVLVLLFWDQFGFDDYSYAGMAIASLMVGIIILWVGMANLQKLSNRVVFNGSDDAWSYSGNYYSFHADGEEWVVVRVGKGFGAGNKHLIAKEGHDSVCIKKERVRWAAWPTIFSCAYYLEYPASYANLNYPELTKQIEKKFGRSGGKFWFETSYDPKDELNVLESRHPVTNQILTADDIKADLAIGTKSSYIEGNRNSPITEIVSHIEILNKRKRSILTQTEDVETNINNTASNAGLTIKDIKRTQHG